MKEPPIAAERKMRFAIAALAGVPAILGVVFLFAILPAVFDPPISDYDRNADGVAAAIGGILGLPGGFSFVLFVYLVLCNKGTP